MDVLRDDFVATKLYGWTFIKFDGNLLKKAYRNHSINDIDFKHGDTLILNLRIILSADYSCLQP